MYNELHYDNSSFFSLKNNIEIIKIKGCIDKIISNQKFKNEINEYLFSLDENNNFKFSNEILNDEIDSINLIEVIYDVILNFDFSLDDIKSFEEYLTERIKNFYKHYEKPVFDPNSYKSVEKLRMKHGVFHIHNYIVFNNRTGDFDSRISQEIYEYKEYGRHVDYFTEQLMMGIAYISNNLDENITNLALVALPRSTKGLKSTIQTSIDIIENWYNLGVTVFDYNCSRCIINCDGLLTRADTIPQSSQGNYLTEEDHKNSISYDKNIISDIDGTAFILLDDITTHATIMRSCRNILIRRGNIRSSNIYMLAIGGTRSY